MESTLFFWIVIGITVIGYFFNLTVDFLNHRHSPSKLPYEIEDVFTAEEYQKSLAYSKANYRFSFYHSLFGIIVLLVVLSMGWLGVFFDYLSNFYSNGIVLTLVFFGALYFLNDLMQIPFSLYHQFVIEKKFDFNRMTMKTFWLDKLKGYVVTAIIGGGIIALLFWLVQVLQSDFWWMFWICIALFMFVMNVLYTQVIAPIFNKFSPLEEGELKEKIFLYSEKVNFPLRGVFMMDGSKRSTKANAYFTGFGKLKRIVLFDTLIEKLKTSELVAVLAHEVGHYKKKHILVSMTLSLLQVGGILYILSLMLFNSELSQAMGSVGQLPVLALNLIAFGILLEPIQLVLSILFNFLSRKNEYEADEWAANTSDGEALIGALKKLTVHNLGDLTPHPLYVFMHYSHPTLLQRIKALKQL